MSRSRRPNSKDGVLPIAAVITLAATMMLLEACGQVQPTASGVPGRLDTPSPAASIGPFSPMAYPPGGDAPCNQVQVPDTGLAAYAGTIRRISATDERTVRFDLCAPDVAFPSRLALAAFAINDSAWLESHIDPSRAGIQPIVSEVNGTGPYRLERWGRGSELSLVRNDAYWGPPANNERLIFRWHETIAQRLVYLQAGTVDGTDDLGPTELSMVDQNSELRAVPRAGMNVFYVGFNNTYAPFDNPKVRQAIAMGIDRQRIVELFYPPGSAVASHFSPCSIPFGCAGNAWYEFDPWAAQQLLADAGFPKGFQTKIQYRDVVRPYMPDPTGIALELQGQLLKYLNVQAELEILPEDSFLTTVDSGKAEGIHLLGRNISIPDAGLVLDPHFGGGASQEFGAGFADIVGALTAGDATVDMAARTAAYTDANEAIRAHIPMVPIAYAGTMEAYRADVGGTQTSPMSYERFASLTPGDRRQFVWLASTEPDGLYCADETTAIAGLVCSQLMEGLYAFEPGGAEPRPALAERCEPDPELTTWSCILRPDIVFHDGTILDANDVVLSFAVQWDAGHPLHRGREGRFQAFIDAFGGLLNQPS